MVMDHRRQGEILADKLRHGLRIGVSQTGALVRKWDYMGPVGDPGLVDRSRSLDAALTHDAPASDAEARYGPGNECSLQKAEVARTIKGRKSWIVSTVVRALWCLGRMCLVP